MKINLKAMVNARQTDTHPGSPPVANQAQPASPVAPNATPAPAAPATPAAPSLDDLQAALNKGPAGNAAAPANPAQAPAAAPPQQANPAAPNGNVGTPATDIMAQLEATQISTSAKDTADAAVAQAFVHTAITEASFRYANQANAASDPDTRQLYVNLNELAAALSANAQPQNAGSDGGLETAIHRLVDFIQKHPALAHVLLPEDIGMMTKALEASYSVVLVKKAENKQKRATKHKTDADTMAAMAALGFTPGG